MKDLKEALTKEYLAKLGAVSIALRQKLSVNGYSGARRSSAKGSSLEFSDYRNYVAGDDLRRVDWNNYARFGKLYLKLFLEEKQGAVNVFLDVSGSMQQDDKFLTAKKMAASFAYIGLQGGDNVNLFLWGQGVIAKKQNVMQKGRFLELVSFLDEQTPKGDTRFYDAIKTCGNLHRGISIVISDFMTDSQIEQGVALLQQKRQDVILLQVLLQEEEKPQGGQALRLTDNETNHTLDVELTGDVLALYEKALQKHRTALAEYCKKRAVGFHYMTEQQDCLKMMYQIL